MFSTAYGQKIHFLTAITATAATPHAITTADDILSDGQQAEALGVHTRVCASAVKIHNVRISRAGSNVLLASRAYQVDWLVDDMDAT
ncbi:hypothetical protein MY11210_008104, partial [Beauveria gryllotalpidicola]